MPQVQAQSLLLDYSRLKDFGTRLLHATGLSPQNAKLVSDSLVESNLRGIDSHGLARLPHYISRIKQGSIRADPKIKVQEVAPATSLVDGDHGLGQLVMWQATEEAIRLARQSGAGWAAVKNSSHCGAMSYFGLKIAESGMIGFGFTHVDPMVVPYGASAPFCGTNPICITAPGADGQTLCLDMATSITPWNSVRNAAIEGVPIPEGWAVDAEGQETTDPNQVAAVHPFGEHKGSGLGIMIDVLCSMLSGSPFGPNIPKMYGDLSQHRTLGGLVGAIDVSRFLPENVFRQHISEMIRSLGSLPRSNPENPVNYPGEPEALCREQRLAQGIPVGLGVIKELNQCAEQLDEEPLVDEHTIQLNRQDSPATDQPLRAGRKMKPASSEKETS